ncbi:MAG: DedA family protein [Gammaproteobacteria bacterium]|nr:DedA family protein [Gammaproteobacteria bacterium]
MDLPALIQQYGNAMVFVGTFLEGETALILGGYAAHQGYLALPAVIGAAFAGALLGDLLCFFLGRYWGDQLLARAPHLHARADNFRALLQRHHVTLILSLRFLYGLRTAGAIAIGMSGIRPWRFTLLVVISAVAWSISMGLAGYLLGSMITRVLADVHLYGPWAAAAVVLLAVAVWLVCRRLAAARGGKDDRVR